MFLSLQPLRLPRGYVELVETEEARVAAETFRESNRTVAVMQTAQSASAE